MKKRSAEDLVRKTVGDALTEKWSVREQQVVAIALGEATNG
jgi:hypothetical protein